MPCRLQVPAELSPFGCFVIFLTNFSKCTTNYRNTGQIWRQIQIDQNHFYFARLSGCIYDPPKVNVLCGKFDVTKNQQLIILSSDNWYQWYKWILHHHCQKPNFPSIVKSHISQWSFSYFQSKLWSGVRKTGSGQVGCPAGRMSSGTGCIIVIFVDVLIVIITIVILTICWRQGRLGQWVTIMTSARLQNIES